MMCGNIISKTQSDLCSGINSQISCKIVTSKNSPKLASELQVVLI